MQFPQLFIKYISSSVTKTSEANLTNFSSSEYGASQVKLYLKVRINIKSCLFFTFLYIYIYIYIFVVRLKTVYQLNQSVAKINNSFCPFIKIFHHYEFLKIVCAIKKFFIHIFFRVHTNKDAHQTVKCETLNNRMLFEMT